MRDTHSNQKAVQHIVAAVVTATVTPASGVDLSGFDAVDFNIAIGAVANIANSPQPSWTFKLQDSDDNTTFADVVNESYTLYGSGRDPVGPPDPTTGVFLTIADAANDENTYRFGYRGPKRYVRVVATAANSPGNTPLCVTALLGYPHLCPTKDG